MKYRIITLLVSLSVWLTPCGEAHAQKNALDGWTYHELSTHSLLPTPAFAVMMQDKDGFLWYGTDGEGLYRDDGYSIKTFNSKNVGKGIMKNDEVTCLCEDKNGRIWFGTRMGLYVLDKKKEVIREIEHKAFSRKKVNSICMDANGNIWVGAAQSLVRFGKNDKAEKELSIGTNKRHEVKEMMLDSKGSIWITILRGGIFRIKKNSDTLEERPWDCEAAASYMVESADRKFYWVGTWGQGVVKYEADGKITPMGEASTENSFGKEVNNMVLDKSHNIMWVSTMDDLHAYSVNGDKLTRLTTETFLPKDKKLIGRITTDRKGNVWVPSYSPHTFALSWTQGAIRRNDVRSMTNKPGYKIMVERIVREGDYYWIYQRRTRLSLYNEKTGEIAFMANQATPTPLSTQKVLAKCKDKEGVWTCNGKHLIHVWHEGMKICWEEDTCATTPNYIASLYDRGNGNLLIGTELQVLNYDYKHRKLKQLTDSVGVVHYLSWGKKGLEYSTTANTLPKLTDRFGHVWSLDETTLTETNPRTGASRKIEASDKNVAVDYFTDMTLYGDSICLGGMGAFCMIAPCRALDDTANNDRIILVDSFHISSMNHLHTDKVRYAYRFEREKLFSSSDNGEWTILKAGENTITYPDLSSGSYKLMAKCTDCYGRWSEPQQLLTISIPAPWYLFWCSIATFLVIRIGIFIWKRKRQKAQTQDEAAQTADKEATDKVTTEPDRTGQSIRQERESKEFMEQLHSIVVRNLDNINYDNDQLAADMGLSRSNLYRKFQRYSDYSSPLEYIRTIRIEEGKRLLRETSHSVTEIAYMTGFSSSQYFAKCFKDMVGLTPKEYRSSH